MHPGVWGISFFGNKPELSERFGLVALKDFVTCVNRNGNRRLRRRTFSHFSTHLRYLQNIQVTSYCTEVEYLSIYCTFTNTSESEKWHKTEEQQWMNKIME